MDGVTDRQHRSGTLNERSADWARFSASVCGAKLHIIYDPDADCPIYASFSAANVNDITAAQAMPIVKGATYVFDLGYYDYAWWAKLHGAGCRIVTRLKRNTPLAVSELRDVRPGGPILSDRIGKLPQRQANNRHNPFSDAVREVQVRIDSGKVLRIVTNDLSSPAEVIAELYKRRWAIELFFGLSRPSTHPPRPSTTLSPAAPLVRFTLLRATPAGWVILNAVRHNLVNLPTKHGLERLHPGVKPLQPMR